MQVGCWVHLVVRRSHFWYPIPIYGCRQWRASPRAPRTPLRALRLCAILLVLAQSTPSTQRPRPATRRTFDIGYPKLFTVGRDSGLPSWSETTVNNFVAARAPTTPICQAMSLRVSIAPVSRPGGPGLLTYSRDNDYELIDRPAGRAWPFNDSSRGRRSNCDDDSSILTSPGQACGRP
jgi:hypothetical protein